MIDFSDAGDEDGESGRGSSVASADEDKKIGDAVREVVPERAVWCGLAAFHRHHARFF